METNISKNEQKKTKYLHHEFKVETETEKRIYVYNFNLMTFDRILQAIDLFTNMRPGEGTLEAYKVIRHKIPSLEKDRILAYDIAAVKNLIHSGKILEAVEKRVGKLQ